MAIPTDRSTPAPGPFNLKRILLVDDNETFLGALKIAFQRTGCVVTTATNGRVAVDLIGLEDFDAIVSDIHMPELNGIQLLHAVKKMRNTPVILTTGFAELKETQEAHELGADGFLAKPFRREDLMSLLMKVLKLEDPAPSTPDLDGEFSRIGIDEFISGSTIRYNIFVRVAKDNYVKVAHEGEDLAIERIRSYMEKKIRYLYLRKEDFRRYVGFNAQLAPMVKANQGVSKEKKLAFLRHTNEIILSQLYSDAIEEDSFQMASTVVQNTTDLLSEASDVFMLLDALKNSGDDLHAHSVGVSLYSVLIAKQTGWTSQATLFKVAMGGLLHDIGLKEIEPEIVRKSREALSAAEVKIFETHPQRGMELLSRVKSVPDDIAQIAYQHHENCLGTGYPKKLSRSRIHPMAKLVSVADKFCELLLGHGGSERYTTKEAAERIAVLHADELDNNFVLSLFQLLRLVPPKHIAPPGRIS